jgi:hypothetical protein
MCGKQTFPKSEAEFDYHLILGPLFWKCPHLKALPNTFKIWNQMPKATSNGLLINTMPMINV